VTASGEDAAERAARRAYVDVGPRQVHYRVAPRDVAAPAGSVGARVLLLHQVSSSSAMFEAVMARLAGDRTCCVAPDLPGFGGSDPLPDGTDVDGYVEAVRDFLAAIGWDRDVCVVGHHTGARLGVMLAARYPDVCGSVVAVGVPYYPDKAARDRRFAKKKVKDPVPVADGAHVLHEWERLGDLSPGMDAALRTRELVDTLRAHNYAAMYRLTFSHDVDPALRALRVPSLFVACENDPLGDKQAHAADVVESGRLATLAAGVFVFDEEPDALAALIARFARRPGAAG
jgi:pimeloyl-ACP methyl ester carboxylesterase